MELRGGDMEDSREDEESESSESSITDKDRGTRMRADYIARCDGRGLNITAALDLAAIEGKTSATIFVSKGTHNLTFDGDIEPQTETHMIGQEGSMICGSAEEINLKSGTKPWPEVGGGRMRLEAQAAGSTFTGLRWVLT